MAAKGVIQKTDLLKGMFGYRDVQLQRGGFVKVRALTRAEAHKIKGKEMPEEEMEQLLLSLALVEPKLTADEVKTWQESSPAGEIEDVIAEIMRASGMEKGAPKAAYNDFRG